MSNKVLMIAYIFPPAGNVGIYRPVKFVKYLPEFGWEPIVLTVRDGKFGKYDERLTKIVPEGTTVYRTRSIEWFNDGENRSTAGRQRKRTLVSRIQNRLRMIANWFAIPDGNISWIPFATVEGVRIIRQEGIRHIFATGKPFSAFIIGYVLKRLTGAKLVIDYRDPWTQNINYHRRSPAHRWIETAQERAIIRLSDVVIANTWVNEELLVRDFGDGQERDKFITIHNGFDGEDFDGVPEKRDDKFTITYAGAFYFSVGSSFKKSAGDDVMRTYSPLYFFEALAKLTTRRPDLRERLRVNFMGQLGHGFDPIIEEFGLGDVIHRLGFLDYEEHLTILKSSTALLLVLSQGEKSRGWIPSKLFSYLGSGNPVLGMVPEGEVRDIIERAKAGIFADPDDVDGMVHAVETLYDQWFALGKRFERNEDEISKFERRALTKRLATALDSIGEGNGHT